MGRSGNRYPAKVMTRRMPEVRDWSHMWELSERLLVRKTGKGVAAWNARIRRLGPKDEAVLGAWLAEQGVTGYARSLLVLERFGYPDFMSASAKELVDGQFTTHPELRPLYDVVVRAASRFGELVVQARKTYISLLTPKRTFARIQTTKRGRLCVALRLDGATAQGRLVPSRIHDSMPVQFELTRCGEFDREARRLLRTAYERNV